MATRRKSTSKKQEEKVESPEQEVIEPKKQVKAASPKSSAKQKETVKKTEAKPAKVEAKPQEKKTVAKKEMKPEPVAEVAPEPVVEAQPEPVVEEVPVKAAAIPVQEEEAPRREVTVGSTVMMPNGQQGVVTNIRRHKVTVSSKTKLGRSYTYKSSQLSLVK